MLKTNDGRETTIETMQAIFNEVCAQQLAGFYWKDKIEYLEQYTSAERANDIMSAIEFMVGGKTDVKSILDTKTMKIYLVYKNAGYYVNIGA